MQIKFLSIEEVIPYESNPRNNDKAVEYVKNSISEFGFKVPIVIDKNNVIVCGHTRYKAAKQLNLESIPCIMADDLTDEQIRAYRIADNKVTEFSVWDYDLLNAELENLDELFNMSQFGFYEADNDYLDNLFDELEEDSQKENDEEETEEFFAVVRFDTEEQLDDFIGYCEQEGIDYERGVKP